MQHNSQNCDCRFYERVPGVYAQLSSVTEPKLSSVFARYLVRAPAVGQRGAEPLVAHHLPHLVQRRVVWHQVEVRQLVLLVDSCKTSATQNHSPFTQRKNWYSWFMRSAFTEVIFVTYFQLKGGGGRIPFKTHCISVTDQLCEA